MAKSKRWRKIKVTLTLTYLDADRPGNEYTMQCDTIDGAKALAFRMIDNSKVGTSQAYTKALGRLESMLCGTDLKRGIHRLAKSTWLAEDGRIAHVTFEKV